jgi:hypothetical protein
MVDVAPGILLGDDLRSITKGLTSKTDRVLSKTSLTLYELVAMRAAFEETDRFELIERIQREEPARLKKLDGRIQRDLETIIQKAMAHEPAQRYVTPEAMADDLKR